ncbi:MAG: class I SAM-dependent methyltransferase [bacterium]
MTAPAPGAARRRPRTGEAVRAGYVEHGVDGYYQRVAATYHNPHEPLIAEAIALAHARRPLPLGAVLDLACGSGEATRALEALGARRIDGVDPYTAPAWRARTGRDARPLTFADVAAGALDGACYDLIVCSFALHLAAPSRLPGITWALARLAPELLITSPHKRPPIEHGWTLIDAFIHRRVHLRRFQSTL